jgi:hypothetical protein
MADSRAEHISPDPELRGRTASGPPEVDRESGPARARARRAVHVWNSSWCVVGAARDLRPAVGAAAGELLERLRDQRRRSPCRSGPPRPDRPCRGQLEGQGVAEGSIAGLGGQRTALASAPFASLLRRLGAQLVDQRRQRHGRGAEREQLAGRWSKLARSRHALGSGPAGLRGGAAARGCAAPGPDRRRGRGLGSRRRARLGSHASARAEAESGREREAASTDVSTSGAVASPGAGSQARHVASRAPRRATGLAIGRDPARVSGDAGRRRRRGRSGRRCR